jgi:hypothetical protein
LEDVFKNRLISIGINQIGAIIKILEEIVELDKIKSYIEGKPHLNEFSKYIKSYAFSICFCLDQLTRVLSDHQDILDFEEDPLFSRAYHLIIPRNNFPTDTEVCIFASNIFGLMDSIFKAKNYEDFIDPIKNVKKYIVIPFKETFYENFELINEYKRHTIDEILLRLGRDYFHLIFHGGDKIRISYDYIVTKGRIFRNREKKIEEFLKESPNERSSSNKELDPKSLKKSLRVTSVERMTNIKETLGDQLFFEGYKFIIEYLWNELFEEPFSKYEFLKDIKSCNNWAEFDSYFVKIRDEIIFPMEKNNEAIDCLEKEVFHKKYTIENATLNSLKQEILFPLVRMDLDDKEKLDSIFLGYPIRLVDSKGSIACANQFILILTGLLSHFFGKKIRIIRFYHPQRIGYSYVIFVESPMGSLLHDYARWYVFLDFAAPRYGTAGSIKRELDKYLSQFSSQIQLSDEEINLKAFGVYIRDKEIKELYNEVRTLGIYKADAKGMISELINAYIFSKLGFQVHWALKENFTNHKEIDLLAYRKFKNRIKFFVIEITTTGEDLVEEITEKTKILKANFKDLLKFLNLDKSLNCRFRGIGISNNSTNLWLDKIVKIINFKVFITNLKDVKLDKKKILEMLEIHE